MDNLIEHRLGKAKGGERVYEESAIPAVAKVWHVKAKGEKVCSICQCRKVRAGVKHRLAEDETYYWYEKLIKVCFGTDTSIDLIKEWEGEKI